MPLLRKRLGLLPLRTFARLDNREGKQYAYHLDEAFDATGNQVPTLTYKVPITDVKGRPGGRYLDVISVAACRRGLPVEYMAMLDYVEARE